LTISGSGFFVYLHFLIEFGRHTLIQIAQIFVAAGLNAFKKRSNLKKLQFYIGKTELDIDWNRISVGIQNIWISLRQVQRQLDKLFDLIRLKAVSALITKPLSIPPS
jgi:hypothetical protein